MQANTLIYGIYRFSYLSVMNVLNPDKSINVTLNSTMNVYVQINPTGLAVFGLPGRIGAMTLGYLQVLTIMPRTYSYDLDDYVPMSNLTFKFYCRTIVGGVTNPFPQYNGTDADVVTQANYLIYSSGCFNNNCNK
jgi:hypothetical protein